MNLKALRHDLEIDRSRANKMHGRGAWDVADVMAIIEQHRARRPRQHLDLQAERELANKAGWFFSSAAWALTLIAVVKRSPRWGVAAALTWMQGGVISFYEGCLDEDLEEQTEVTS